MESYLNYCQIIVEMKSSSFYYSIIWKCQIILISSEKKSLHNNKYYVYISYKFYSTKGIIHRR